MTNDEGPNDERLGSRASSFGVRRSCNHCRQAFVVHAHPTFALTFLLVACGAVIRYREKSMKNTDVRNILYWAITLMAMSLIIGWGSANILEKRVGRQQEIFTAASAAAIDVLAIRG